MGIALIKLGLRQAHEPNLSCLLRILALCPEYLKSLEIEAPLAPVGVVGEAEMVSSRSGRRVLGAVRVAREVVGEEKNGKSLAEELDSRGKAYTARAKD
jgi:hypothetical protein